MGRSGSLDGPLEINFLIAWPATSSKVVLREDGRKEDFFLNFFSRSCLEK